MEHGAERTLTDTDGATAFAVAKTFNLQEILAHGQELLVVAIMAGDIDTSTGLLDEQICSVTAACIRDKTALHIAAAASVPNAAQIVSLLLDRGADINKQGGFYGLVVIMSLL